MKKLVGFGVGLSLLVVPFISFADSTVSSSAGVGATVSPNGSIVVTTGNTQTFSFGASRGYQLLGVSVNGVNQGAVGSYLFTEDGIDHTIFASAQSVGNNLMPFCSGPMAPGWQAGVVGGGCGGTDVVLEPGTEGCPFWFVGGCIKQ